MPLFAGSGVTPTLRGNVNNVISMQPCSVYPLYVPGWYEVTVGAYTCLQEWDPVSLMYRVAGGGSIGTAVLSRVYSDGSNYRLANLTGGTVGASLTAAGSGYIAPPTCTPSAGNAIFRCIVGGALNTVVTVQNGGANYTYPPIVLVSAPPPGGIQATAYCALTAGAVSSVTVQDQGAGYNAPPTFTFLNDPREGANGIGTGGGAAAIGTLTGAGTVTGVLGLDPGLPLSAVPTLTFSGGGGTGAAATAIMCWSAVAYTGTGGTYAAGSTITVSAVNTAQNAAPPGPPSAGGLAYQNWATQQGLVKTRNGVIVASLSGTAIQVAGQKLVDGGIYTVGSAGLAAVTSGGAPTALAALGFTMGGLNDESIILTT